MMTVALQDLEAVFSRWRVWTLLAWQDVYLRYKRSLIGPFWISISQSITILAAAFLYSQIFNLPFKEFLGYITAGVLVWNFISFLLGEASTYIVEAEGLIKSLPIPITVLAARIALRNLIVLMHNIVVFGAILIFFGTTFTWTALLAVLAIPVLTVMGFLAAIALGPVCALYRDLALIIQNGLAFMFFLTPIIWKADQLPERAIFVLGNPFYHLVELVRAPLIAGTPASGLNWAVAAGCLCLLAGLAWVSLVSSRGKLYFWI